MPLPTGSLRLRLTVILAVILFGTGVFQLEALQPILGDPIVDSPASFQRDPLLSGIHTGLGWATVALGAATGLLNPSHSSFEVHQALAYTTAGLAAATMGIGIWAHWGEVGPSFSWDANNVHALLGAAGGTMMMVAPFVAPAKVHAALGELGELSMGIAMVWKLVY